MRILELFCGIGGVAQACRQLPGTNSVVAAIDINQQALEVYKANFASPTYAMEIASIRPETLADFAANLWWMSPPCQPFTRRGRQRDLDDPRTAPLTHLVNAIAQVKPQYVAIENVVGFESSKAFEFVRKTLVESGYLVTSLQLCGTQFGIPNLRPRFFVMASRMSSQRGNLERQAGCGSSEFDQLSRSGESTKKNISNLSPPVTQAVSYTHLTLPTKA